MGLKLVNRVTAFLAKNKGKMFTAREIAIWIIDNCPEECEKKMNQSKSKEVMTAVNQEERRKALIKALVSGINSSVARRKNRPIGLRITGVTRPKRYYFAF